MPIDIDTEINRFLDFWEKHARDPDELRVEGWVMFTPGCEGDFGCCSKSHDMAGLVDALYELASREECHSLECKGFRGCGRRTRIKISDLPAPGNSCSFACEHCGAGWSCSRDAEGALRWESFYRAAEGG